MRGGVTEENETQKWATSKKRLRTTGMGDQRIGVLFLTEVTGFLHTVQTGYGAHLASYHIGTVGFFPGSKTVEACS
jgi:hypothetical protein